MDKHTKHLLFFYSALLLASVSAFCIMFVLPMTESGRSPPGNLHKDRRRFLGNRTNLAQVARSRLKSLDFYTLKR